MSVTVGSMSDRAFNNYLGVITGSSKLSPAAQLSILHSMRHNLRPQDLRVLSEDIAARARQSTASKGNPPRLGIRTGVAKRSNSPADIAAGRAPASSLVPVASPATQRQVTQPFMRTGRRQLSASMLPSNPSVVNPLAEAFPLTTRAAAVFTPPVLS